MIELDTVTPFFEDKQERLAEILGRYPEIGRRSAVMPLLWEVQRAERYVSEARVAEIAEILDLHPTEVKGVMSFYSTFHGEPVGRWHLQVCSTLSCALAGSDPLCDRIVERLGIVPGETDREGRFSLQKVECLGSCTTAPVVQVNDTYYERVGRHRLEQLLDGLERDDPPDPWSERHGDNEGLGGAPPAEPAGRVPAAEPGGKAGPPAAADAAASAEGGPQNEEGGA